MALGAPAARVPDCCWSSLESYVNKKPESPVARRALHLIGVASLLMYQIDERV